MRLLVFLFVISICYILSVQSLGTSILGIDFGTDTFKVMTLKSNAPDIVLNDQSGRKTDSLVGFDINGERVFGKAADQLVRKKKNFTFSIC